MEDCAHDSHADQTQANGTELGDDANNTEDPCRTTLRKVQRPGNHAEIPASRGYYTNEKRPSNINDIVQIQRPKGTPGTDWSIAIEMGLAGSTKKKERYNLLKVSH